MLQEVLNLFGKMFLVLTSILAVLLYLSAVALGPALFYFTPEGLNASTRHLDSLHIWIFNLPASIPVNVNVGLVFLVVWAVFTLSFVAAWKTRENFHSIIRESAARPLKKLFNNYLFAMPILNSMTFLAVLAIQSFQEVGGIPTGGPSLPGTPFLDLFDLSYSALVEEVGFRLFPIGAFLAVYLWASKRPRFTSLKQKVKLLCMAVLFPDKAKRLVGAETVSENGIFGGISRGEWVMLLFSSAVFGLAHFDPGVSWEIGKITSASVAGAAMGLSYLVYGAQAPLIMHWFFNSYTQIFGMLVDVYAAPEALFNVVVAVTFTLGLLGWYAAATLGVLKLSKSLTKTAQEDEGNPLL